MYAMLKSKALLFGFLLLGPFLFLKPRDAVRLLAEPLHQTNNCITPDNPVMVIIGEDRSQSFPGVNSTPEEIAAICKAISESGRGGQVYLGIIGNKPPIKYEFCDIQPLPKAPPGAAIGAVANCKLAADKVKADNEKAIKEFLPKCRAILNTPITPITDLDGFLAFAGKLVDAPGASKYEPWLYLNSDGIHSLSSSHKANMDCNKKPRSNRLRYYISVWDPKYEQCNPSGEFLGPAQFARYFKNNLNK